MANKKRRLEEDPNASDRGKGSNPKPEVKDHKITIKIDDFDLPQWSKDDLEKAREAAERMMRSGMPGALFGGGPVGGGSMRHSGGGNIHVEGSDGRMRPWGSNHYTVGGLMDFINQYAVPQNMIGEEVDFKDAVARMLHTKAVEVWDSLMGWQFACTYNEGQATFWFTARYYDEEAGEPLVTETLEFSEEVLAQRNWDETHLEVERQMEKMHEKCVADLAMFDE